MQRLIIATDVWQPKVDGVVRAIEGILKPLKDNGFAVTIIHPGLFYTLPLFFYPEIRYSLFPRKKIEKIFENENPDYIHIATEGPIGFSVRAACLRKKLKFTTSYHTHLAHYVRARTGLFFATIYAILKWFHNAGNITMVSTESLKQELAGRGFKNVAVCPLGVDAEVFKRNPQPPDSYNFARPVFAYLGRIAKEKNIEEYLKCELSGTKLVIGDGPGRKKLEKKYGKKAIFVGYKKGKELVDLLSICDVLVFPSRTDTFGLTIIEALSCGVPVAAHNVMGPKDIITSGVDGILDEDLKKAALGCLNLKREKCRQKALTFSWETSARYFINNLVKVK